MVAVNVTNAVEASGEARNAGDITVAHSSLTVDHSLKLPEMKPRIVYDDTFVCYDAFS
ncbi:hypothetical protein HanRHA438_Chr16g0768611 [Helianthus annuus]|nr:hypothetical protein HanRHA438_Chr16g0768611 [Helianthus annuus]